MLDTCCARIAGLFAVCVLGGSKGVVGCLLGAIEGLRIVSFDGEFLKLPGGGLERDMLPPFRGAEGGIGGPTGCASEQRCRGRWHMRV